MFFYQIYDQQGDRQAEIVRIPLESEGVNLHAANARKSCYKKFTSVRNTRTVQSKSTTTDKERDEIINEMTSRKSWD